MIDLRSKTLKEAIETRKMQKWQAELGAPATFPRQGQVAEWGKPFQPGTSQPDKRLLSE